MWTKKHCDILSQLNKIEHGNGNMNKRHRNGDQKKTDAEFFFFWEQIEVTVDEGNYCEPAL